MMKGTVAVVVLSVSAVVAAPAMASPMTWNFAGSTTGGGITDIPMGSPVTVSWTFDPSAPNGCAPGEPAGSYSGQSATVTIDSAVGPLVYQAGGGFLLVDTNLAVGCVPQGPTVPGTAEARLVNWSGQDLAGQPLFTFGMAFPGGLFWSQPPSNGVFPAVQPAFVFLQGPYFFGLPGTTQTVGVQATLAAVPEPATVGLVACGLSVLAIRRRRRGRPAR